MARTKDELIVATVNDLVEVECHKKGVKPFRTLTTEDVVKFAVRGVQHRLHNYEYNAKARQKGKLFDKLVEAGIISEEDAERMLKK